MPKVSKKTGENQLTASPEQTKSSDERPEARWLAAGTDSGVADEGPVAPKLTLTGVEVFGYVTPLHESKTGYS
jgi:hypothetical protein